MNFVFNAVVFISLDKLLNNIIKTIIYFNKINYTSKSKNKFELAINFSYSECIFRILN